MANNESKLPPLDQALIEAPQSSRSRRPGPFLYGIGPPHGDARARPSQAHFSSR
jgi:hypothetical protein